MYMKAWEGVKQTGFRSWETHCTNHMSIHKTSAGKEILISLWISSQFVILGSLFNNAKVLFTIGKTDKTR